jgi:heptaprenyl diphosphate synthase
MSIAHFFQPIEQDLLYVEQEIHQLVNIQNPILAQAAQHFLQASGKRMRPALVLLAGQCHKEAREETIRAAIALEFLHMASLVHDDIIDQADTRRGIATINSRWDNRAAVLLGDYFYGKALQQAALCGVGAVGQMSEIIDSLVGGECSQFQDAYDYQISEGQYFERIAMKTAHFIAACCRLGALTGGAPAETQEALAGYGRNLGMAYQIRDDILDFVGEQSRTGKPAYLDLENGHITLPVIHALRYGKYQKEVADILKHRVCDPSLRGQVFHWLLDGGSISYALTQADEFIHKAKAFLHQIPVGPANNALSGIADFTVRRVH